MLLKTAWRHIIRQKTAAAINVLGLTLGLCACIVIFLICSYDLGFDRFHPDGNRIFRVTGSIRLTPDRTVYLGSVQPPVPGLLKKEVSGLQNICAFYPYPTKISIPRNGFKTEDFDSRVPGSLLPGTILTSAAYFDIFRYTWLAGSASGDFEKPNRVVISEKRAHTYFGEAKPETLLGREIVYNDSIRATISGVVKDWNENTDFPFTDFISLATSRESILAIDYNLSDWNGRSAQCFVKLPAGTTPSRINTVISSFVQTHDPVNSASRLRLQLQPLADIHFNAQFQEDIRTADKPTLYGLIGIAGLILLLAIVNFINLSSAQMLERMKETGIRKVLGSTGGKIRLQFLTESGILTLVASFLALFLVPVALYLFRPFIPEGLEPWKINASRILFVCGTMFFTALIAGLYPATLLASYEPVMSLKGINAKPTSGVTLIRKSMIVFQFAISIGFIICALVIHSQLSYIREKDLGLNTDQVITISTDGKKGDKRISLLAEKLKAIPGVRETTPEILPPVGNQTFGLQILDLKRGREPVNVLVRGGDDRFILFYRIHLLAGRNIRKSDSLNELVINETYARSLGFARPLDAIGQTLTTGPDNFPEFSGKTLPIVGVVSDFNELSLHERIQAAIIAHLPIVENRLAVRLTKGTHASTTQTLAAIERVWRELYPDGNFEYRFLDQAIAEMYEKEGRTSTLLMAAVGMSIFISCIGLFGMMLFSVRTRTREIGIRKLLGATVTRLAYTLNREYLRLIILALFISVPVAGVVMQRWLNDFVFRIHISPWHFILAGFFATLIGSLTVAGLALKAASANPVKSLRSE